MSKNSAVPPSSAGSPLNRPTRPPTQFVMKHQPGHFELAFGKVAPDGAAHDILHAKAASDEKKALDGRLAAKPSETL